MRTLIVLLLALSGATRAFAQSPKTPKLVVFIAVDQLREDYLHRFRPQFIGGLKRLTEQGAFFTNAYQDHAVTVTAVGHSTMLSGRFPRSTGIISNTLGVPDPQARMLNGGPGASPFRFRGSVLFDWLRIQTPGSRALSVSVKDRSAILPIGRAKQSVFWYSGDGTFSTSNYYADTLPTWVRTFNAQKLPEKYAGREWKPLLDPRLYWEADTVEAEGKNPAFPHRVPAEVREAVRVLANFPWMDQILLELALTGVDSMKLGKTDNVDLLSMSLSTMDLIGHEYGPDSREVHDQVIRLDRALGIFFDELYKRFAPEEVVVALTADHGVSSFPEVVARTKAEALARHVDVRPALNSLQPLLGRLGIPGGGVSFDAQMLQLNEAAFKHDHALMDTVANAFATAIRKLPGVARVDFVRDLAKGDTINDPITRRWYQMVPRDLAIPVVVTWKEGYVAGAAESATHGSPYDADAHVPIIFYGPQFRPGLYKEFVRTVDIAPTLAKILDVHPTEPIDGKPLRQALR